MSSLTPWNISLACPGLFTSFCWPHHLRNPVSILHTIFVVTSPFHTPRTLHLRYIDSHSIMLKLVSARLLAFRWRHSPRAPVIDLKLSLLHYADLIISGIITLRFFLNFEGLRNEQRVRENRGLILYWTNECIYWRIWMCMYIHFGDFSGKISPVTKKFWNPRLIRINQRIRSQFWMLRSCWTLLHSAGMPEKCFSLEWAKAIVFNTS